MKATAVYCASESMPQELIDLCLSCNRVKCVGKCQKYIAAARQYRNEHGNTYVRNMNGVRTGFEPKRYELYGQMVTVREASELYGTSKTTLRKYLNQGLSMQEVIENYGRGKKRRAQ